MACCYEKLISAGKNSLCRVETSRSSGMKKRE